MRQGIGIVGLLLVAAALLVSAQSPVSTTADQVPVYAAVWRPPG